MHTYKLNRGTDLLRLERAAFGMRHRAGQIEYIRLPLGRDEAAIGGNCWHLALELTGTNQGLLPLEIVDDMVIGRGTKSLERPDLDLTPLNALALGVSRRHARLRPTPHHLYLIDLGSSNGTLVNGLPLGQSKAHSLAEGDHLSLGKLNMSVASIEAVPGALRNLAVGPDAVDMTRQIMVVDDDFGMLRLLDKILQRSEFAVLKADHAHAALEMLEQTTPDLFILDVMMPGMNGFECCRQIRARPQTAQTPVIFLSVLTDPVSVQDGLEAGADKYLTKPFLPDALVTEVRESLAMA